MKKIHLSLAGMVVGLLIALCGLLVLTGALGGDTFFASSSPVGYDSGYAMFGADYYNYVCNNTAEAAAASYAIGQNLRGISELLTNVCGIFLMGLGLLSLCAFGLVFLQEKSGRPLGEALSGSVKAPQAPAAPNDSPSADPSSAGTEDPDQAPDAAPVPSADSAEPPAEATAVGDPRQDPLAPMR